MDIIRLLVLCYVGPREVYLSCGGLFELACSRLVALPSFIGVTQEVAFLWLDRVVLCLTPLVLVDWG